MSIIDRWVNGETSTEELDEHLSDSEYLRELKTQWPTLELMDRYHPMVVAKYGDPQEEPEKAKDWHDANVDPNNLSPLGRLVMASYLYDQRRKE